MESLLTNHVGNDIVNKGKVLEACDFILTPYHKLFHGKTVKVYLDETEYKSGHYYLGSGLPKVETKIAEAKTRSEKILWTILAVITAPFAAIAALFKLIIHPSIGTMEKPFTISDHYLYLNEKGFKNAVDALNELKSIKLHGRVHIKFNLNQEQIYNRYEPELFLNVIQKLIGEARDKGIFYCQNMYREDDYTKGYHCMKFDIIL